MTMKILFVCGVFGKDVEKDLIVTAKKPIEYSANVFQEKIISGFNNCNTDIEIVSAPFIGSFPNASKQIEFNSRNYQKGKYNYVSFNNIWGFRNFSRVKALREEITSFANAKDNQKMIVVYSPHTPFLQAAVYAKKIDPTIKICLVVPDLPQYMNLNSKISVVYRIAKKIDIAKFERLSKHIDSYILLTEEMKNRLNVGNRPYMVVEGIISSNAQLVKMKKDRNAESEKTEIRIVYTGKTNERFGIKNLVDAFGLISDKNYRLIICGKGDSDDYISAKAKNDTRIEPKGQVTPAVAAKYVEEATVLVNPRLNDDEYTKYSFPSKNIEYLISGNPVVAYLLDGVPAVYKQFIYIPEDDSTESLAACIIKAAEASDSEVAERRAVIAEYLERLVAKNVIHQLIKMNFSDESACG